MPFVKECRVNYYDCDVTDRLKLSAAMQYMQQASSEQMAERGASTEELFRQQLVFLLVKHNIRVYRMPQVNEPIRILTAPVATRGVRFVREFAIETPEGERLLLSNTLWVLVDTVEHKLLRPKAFPHPFELQESFLQGAIGDEAIVKPDADQAVEQTLRRIRYSHLDHNRHVNNCIYADFILDALPFQEVISRPVRSLILHFQHEAGHGQQISISSTNLGNTGYWLEGRADGEACFAANLFFGDGESKE